MPEKGRRITWVLAGLLGVCSGALLFWTPYRASDLGIAPDSVEYVTGALRLLEHGSYDIAINETPHPPRYPPWFSAVILTPAYFLLGREPGNGILPVFLLAVAGVGAAFLLGRSVSGDAGGWLAGALLLSVRPYTRLAKEILTDVPAAALGLILCFLFVRLRASPARPAARELAAAGVLLALSASLRPVTAMLALPFALIAASRPGLRKLSCGALLLLPLAALGGAQAAYNERVFGSFLRNGYNYWVPVPFDYPRLLFSPAYLLPNLESLRTSGVVYLSALIAVLVLVGRRRRSADGAPVLRFEGAYRSLWVFAAAGLAPQGVIHLFYFYPDGRFFLPLSALLAVIAGAIAGAILSKVAPRTIVWIQAVVAAGAVAFRLLHAESPPERRDAADTIREHAPEGSVVISGIDPVYLGTVVGEGARCFFVPISRRVEYASKLVCPRRVERFDPPPADWRDHRSAGLRKGGALEVVSVTADEDPAWIREAVGEGRPVFLCTVGIAPEDAPIVASLRETYHATEVGAGLLRLRPSSRTTASRNAH